MFYDEMKEQKIERIYSVEDVVNGFYFWFWKLFNFCLTIFEYENLPETLPAREIESNLILTGHDVIFPNGADVITCNCNIYGFDLYYNPQYATFANPRLQSKTLEIGKTCEIIYNNSLKDNVLYVESDGALLSFIRRYARMLADIESTLDTYMINSRLTSFPCGSNDSIVNNLKMFFRKIRAGKQAIISDDSIIQQFRNVDINRSNIHDGVNDWLIARDKILEMFFRDIGVKFYNPKKAQVSEDELQINNQLLVISLDDMLKARKEGVERVNKLFGLNIKVDISESFKIEEKEQEDGENGNETYNRTVS